MKKFTSATQQLAYLVILANLSVSVSMLTTAAKTIQDFKKWEKGENLIENGSFEDGIAAWNLEDGACCDRGGQYEWEVEKKDASHGRKALKIIGVKATGTDWHAKVKHKSTSMQAGKNYTVVFWAKAKKMREVSLSIQMQRDPWTFY